MTYNEKIDAELDDDFICILHNTIHNQLKVWTYLFILYYFLQLR